MTPRPPLIVLLLALSPGEIGAATSEETSDFPNAKKPWVLPAGKYAAAMKAHSVLKDDSPLNLEVAHVQDAYRYEMARGIEALAKKRYSGQRLEKALRTLHKKASKAKGRELFFVTLSPPRDGSHYFFQLKRFPEHFVARPFSRSGVRISEMKPALKSERWKVFDHRGGGGFGGARKLIPLREKVTFAISAKRLKNSLEKPVQFFLQGLVRQKYRRDRHDSIDLQKRQISCRGWNTLAVAPMTLEFPPGRSLVRPPSGFEELLERLEKTEE